MVPSLQQPKYVRRQGVHLSPDLRRPETKEVTLGIGSLPYLADHGFQDMVVLPGSFCVATTLRLHREIFKSSAGILRNIKFQRPVILSNEETLIKIEARQAATSLVEYLFFQPTDTSHFASVEVNDAEATEKLATKFSIEAFTVQDSSLIDTKEFYRALRQNGNQYGPRFQNLSAIWRSGNHALGRLSLSRRDLESQPRHLHPAVLDSITQLLATFIFEKGRAFALESIDQIEISDSHFLETTLWARAKLTSDAADDARGFSGDIDVFDEFGNRYLAFGGVSFRYLEGSDTANPSPKLDICIAASFTAEPVEDSLQFWADRFGLSGNVQFAPYHQIFQQLLDKESAFRRNDDGINVILLNLEDWIARDEPASLRFDRQKLEKSDGLRCVLPNGLEIVHLNQYETDYLYQEIFRDECYLRHGIHLNDGDTVVDIGANIGLFSLFVLNRFPRARIYAFEPSPVVCKLLKANCEAYGREVHVFQSGVSDQPKSAKFTFYDKSSVFSGFHSNAVEDKKAIEAVVRNILGAEVDQNSSDALVKELTAKRLHRRTYPCQLTSLSEIIRKNEIERIHLLKIDAEKSEFDIIQGIEEAHWPLIDQLVIEVHDRTGQAVKQIEQLLIAKGYACAIEQEKLLENSGLFNIYATRSEKTQASTVSSPRGIGRSLKRNGDEFLSALSSFATECDRPILLCFCPPSPDSLGKTELNQLLHATEQKLLQSTSKLSNVHGISSATTLDRCQSQNYDDSHSRELGHVPYNREGYAAIGTILFENIFRLRTKPFKVLVLDCDDTLWQGACGEDGPLGVEITEGHRALQQFVVKQVNAGVLVCLCSKNNEKDVFEVFAQNQKMILKREHLTACQINWNDKSDNIKMLATKLSLGLDSILFLDNNPVECAEVKINCPEVLTLQLPERSDHIPLFLEGIWPLPGNPLTSEDQKRTRMYQQNTEREQFRQQAFTLKDFLDGLQLRIAVTNPTDEQISRVSQLTWRTNQFNFTTIRRSEAEIQNWLANENRGCLVAAVSDRFGDYGLVGVLLYEIGIDRTTVDTFLLSCRALGRGVEHRMLAELARIAQREEKEFVEINYLPTEKNAPALEFIKNLTSNYPGNAASSFTFPTRELASLEYQPVEKAAACAERKTVTEKHLARSAQTFREFDRSETFQNICSELSGIGALSNAVDNFMGRNHAPALSAAIGPAETLETSLANLWGRVLGRRQIGLNETFFEAGGTSLKAVQLVALIQRELKRSLPITALFECPTISLLAARMKSSAPAGDWIEAVKALRRGQQRRHGRITRRIP
jgi:FkbH-like protein/FkbM family methyltransferase